MEAPGAPGAPDGTAVEAATEKVFTTYDIQSCLYDTHRVEYLSEAIRRTVKEGDVVVDAGSGTGLLGMLAAQRGAARVYCLELNPEFIEVIEENARRNDLADRIIVVNADATRYLPPEPADVLISEVISGGFFYEPQLQILNNLRKSLKPGGFVVPMAMNNYLELLDAQELLYGLRFNFDSRFKDLDLDRSLSTSAAYLSTDFHEFNDPAISGQVRVRATETATVNAVRVAYDIQFAPDVRADKPTQFLLNPQIIFLPQTLHVDEGREYDISVAYRASDSPLRCRIDVRPVVGR